MKLKIAQIRIVPEKGNLKANFSNLLRSMKAVEKHQGTAHHWHPVASVFLDYPSYLCLPLRPGFFPLELPRFSGRFISCDSFGFMGNSAGGLLKVHGREVSEC